MTEKEVKYINTWEKNIEKGKNTFLIKFTIFWTLWMAISTPLLMMLFDFEFSLNYLISQFSLTKTIIMSLPQVIVGFFFSQAIWRYSIKKYNKLINKD